MSSTIPSSSLIVNASSLPGSSTSSRPSTPPRSTFYATMSSPSPSPSPRPAKRPRRGHRLPARFTPDPSPSLTSAPAPKSPNKRSPERTLQRPSKLARILPRPPLPSSASSDENSQSSTINSTSEGSPKLQSNSSASSIASLSMAKEGNVAELRSQLEKIAEGQNQSLAGGETTEEEFEAEVDVESSLVQKPSPFSSAADKGKGKEREILLAHEAEDTSALPSSADQTIQTSTTDPKGKGKQREIIPEVEECQTLQAPASRNTTHTPQPAHSDPQICPILQTCGEAVQNLLDLKRIEQIAILALLSFNPEYQEEARIVKRVTGSIDSPFLLPPPRRKSVVLTSSAQSSVSKKARQKKPAPVSSKGVKGSRVVKRKPTQSKKGEGKRKTPVKIKFKTNKAEKVV